jgi:hypothetical protein
MHKKNRCKKSCIMCRLYRSPHVYWKYIEYHGQFPFLPIKLTVLSLLNCINLFVDALTVTTQFHENVEEFCRRLRHYQRGVENPFSFLECAESLSLPTLMSCLLSPRSKISCRLPLIKYSRLVNRIIFQYLSQNWFDP